jgi:hypothetical protein
MYLIWEHNQTRMELATNGADRKKRFWVSAWPAVLALFLISLIRFGLMFRFPLGPDETYYWDWSRHLDWGYYDQGPMIAWVIRFFCTWLGDTVVGIRVEAVLGSLGAQIFVYLFTRELFGWRAGLLSILPLTFAPLILAGGFIASYDSLVVMFWAAALYFAYLALFRESFWSWIGLGVVLGLGTLSKYTMVLFVVCFVIFLLTVPRFRCYLLRFQFYLSLAIAFFIVLPNLLWLSRHDWITFSHLGRLTDQGNDFLLKQVGDYLITQLGVITPILFFLSVWVMFWAAKSYFSSGDIKRWFVFCFCAPILIFFLISSFRGKILPNWPVCAWVAVPSLIAAWVSSVWDKFQFLRKRIFVFNVAIVTSAVFSLLLIWPELFAKFGIKIPLSWSRPINRMYGGLELGQAADQAYREMVAELGSPVYVGGMNYGDTSRAAFYMANQPIASCLFLGQRLNNYIYWPGGMPTPGSSMLVVMEHPHDHPKGYPIDRVFERIVRVDPPVDAFRTGLYDEPVWRVYLYKCYVFRPDRNLMTPMPRSWRPPSEAGKLLDLQN